MPLSQHAVEPRQFAHLDSVDPVHALDGAGGVGGTGTGTVGTGAGGVGGDVAGGVEACMHSAYHASNCAHGVPAAAQQLASRLHALYTQKTDEAQVVGVGTGTGTVGTGTGGLTPPENMTSITLKKLFDVSPTSHTLRMMWYPSSVGTLQVWSVVIGGCFMPPSTTQNGASSNVARVSGAFGFHPARVM